MSWFCNIFKKEKKKEFVPVEQDLGKVKVTIFFTEDRIARKTFVGYAVYSKYYDNYFGQTAMNQFYEWKIDNPFVHCENGDCLLLSEYEKIQIEEEQHLCLPEIID
jgi:hypothetical protein